MTEKLTADWGADSHSGSRIVNEDFIAFTRYDDETEIAKKGICLVVTDGSASVRCGQRAAQMAAFKILESYYGRKSIQDPKLALRISVESALSLLDRESLHSKCDGMAVSIAAAAIFNGLLHVAWVGDARAYVLRDGQITTLTGTSLLDPIQDPRFLIGPARGILEVSKPVESGDRVILCTDGIFRVLNDNAIARLTTSLIRPEEAAQALIQGALAQHTNDNASAIVFDNGTALVEHTAQPAAATARANLRWIPMALAALGIVLFVAGSAALLSRRSIRPAAPTADATPIESVSVPSLAAVDPANGIAEATVTTGPIDVPTVAAVVEVTAIPATEIPPTETAVPPTDTPLPPTVTPLPTATAIPLPTQTPVATVTHVQRSGNTPKTNTTAATALPPTRVILPTTTVLRPTARPTSHRPRPTRTPLPPMPTAALPMPTDEPPRPTDVPKPPDPPQPQPTTPPVVPTDPPVIPTNPPPPTKPLPPPPPPNA